jgi:hypothetical protein
MGSWQGVLTSVCAREAGCGGGGDKWRASRSCLRLEEGGDCTPDRGRVSAGNARCGAPERGHDLACVSHRRICSFPTLDLGGCWQSATRSEAANGGAHRLVEGRRNNRS